MGSAVSSVASAVGGVVGGITGGLVNGMVPQTQQADQSRVNGVQGQQSALATDQIQQGQEFRNTAAQQYNRLQPSIEQSQAAVNQAQNAATGGNVGNSLALLQAQANGTAPSAAEAQLQSGKDQAIATQSALANSGNLSQMIGGQRAAMNNAASLTQQAANQATQLRANQQQVGQQTYANAAATQAGQLANNAALQQQQAQQQIGLYNSQNQMGLGYSQAAGQSLGGASGSALGGANLQQGALSQTSQNQAQATGGLLNAGGGAAMMLASDSDLKKDVTTQLPEDDDEIKKARLKKAKAISESFGGGDSKTSSDINGKEKVKKASMLEKFLDSIDPVSFEYKDATGDMGRTPGTHIGVIAQQIEKAPGGESMVSEGPEGKMIDVPSAVGTLLAAAAQNHDRINDLEELFKSKKKGT